MGGRLLSSATARSDLGLDSGVAARSPDAKLGVRLADVDAAKAEALPRLHLTDAPDVERADRRNLRITACRLPIGQEDDRLTIADHLDPPERHAVGDDVVAARVLDDRSAQARAHAIALWRHLVWAAEQGRDAGRREPIVLGAQHDGDLRLRRVVGHAIGANAPERDRRRGPERQHVALPERAATDAAELPAYVRRPGPKGGRRLDATCNG